MSKSLLDALISGAKDLTAQANLSDLTGRAKETWGQQSTLTKGAIAGGLLGVLLSGNARKLVGTGLKLGGAAAIGGLAFRAYEEWKSGKAADANAETPTAFLPKDAEAEGDLSLRLLQAMVAATKADGHVTEAERAAITAQLPRLNLGTEAEALIAQELAAPFDPARIAALARTEAEAVEIYTASLLVVDSEAPAEKGYLALLAARLNLDAGLVAHLHAKLTDLA